MIRIQDRQQRIKQVFDKKAKKEEFQIGDLVLKWDAPKQDKGKHGKFEAGLSKYLRFSQTTRIGCKIWRVKKFSTAQ
jgi:hypothetical protein